MSRELAPLFVRVLLVEDNRLDALLIKDAASKAQDCQIRLDHAQSLGEARVQLQSQRYDVILLDLMLPDSFGLETVIHAHEAAPGTPIVVLSSVDDETMAIRAVQYGAQDYLVKGQLTPKQVLRAIRYAIVRFDTRPAQPAPAAPGNTGKVIALSGAKGGVGGTLVACHMAAALQAGTGERVVLIDLDAPSGMTAFVMKVKPAYSILDAAQNMSRLDLSLWKSLVSRSEHEIDVLPGPADPFAEKDRPAVEVLRALFSFVRLHYDWIIIDVGRWSPAFTPALLNDIDKLFIVTSPEIMGLYKAKQIIGTLPENGGASERIGLVLNRMPKRPEVGLKDLETVLGMPVYAVLPEDANGISDALTRGKLVSSSGSLGQAIDAFARRVAGAEEPVLKDRKLSFLRFLPVRI